MVYRSKVFINGIDKNRYHLYGCSKGFKPYTGKYKFNIKIIKLSNKMSSFVQIVLVLFLIKYGFENRF